MYNQIRGQGPFSSDSNTNPPAVLYKKGPEYHKCLSWVAQRTCSLGRDSDKMP
jgi:hypothetical protein